MSYPHILTGLTDREAITDAMYRALIGFDKHDIPIFNSAFLSENVTFELSGAVFNNLEAIRTQLLDFVGPMDTTHVVTNVRVDLKDASTASLTAYAMNQHCPPGRGGELDGPKLLAASEYFIDFVKDERDGVWKITKWVMKLIWKQGDASVMQRTG